VELVDLAPTISDLVFDDKFSGPGRALGPWIRGERNDDPGSPAFLERDHTLGAPRPFLALDQYAAVIWPYKLFQTVQGAVELYDLAADPGETNDLARERPETVLQLKARWDEWIKDTPAAPTDELQLTPSELDKLRDLGYIQ
jgi:arylsulfatase A-like enzyme